MKAAEITDTVLAELRTGRHRFARLNYANGDMVGHTGVFEATVVAVEAVDLSLGRLLRGVAELQGIALVTADHGNADEMYERDKKGAIETDEATGRPKAKTSHSLNPVPFIVFDPGPRGEAADAASASARRERRLREDLPQAGLANVAATIAQILGYEPPEGYEPGLLAV
jgi:2,3-bisphosphoglycerate-independent phosphoglycerate mutase